MAKGTHVYSYNIDIPQIRASGGAEIEVYIEEGGTPIGASLNEDGEPQIHVLVEPMGGPEFRNEFAVFRYGRAPGPNFVQSERYLGAFILGVADDLFHVFWIRATKRKRSRRGPDIGEKPPPRRRRRKQ